jgi:TPR repeat protein
MVGRALLFGQGLAQDRDRAREWLLKAAGQNHAGAQGTLGFMAEDPVEAVMWLRKAAEQGDEMSQLNLTNAYLRGSGVAKDSRLAAEWFLKAATQGDVNATYQLGLLFEKGDGVPRNQKAAIDLFRAAADAEHGFAQLTLGERHADGVGVPKDPVESYKWTALSLTHFRRENSQPLFDKFEAFTATLTEQQIAEGKARVAAFQKAHVRRH